MSNTFQARRTARLVSALAASAIAIGLFAVPGTAHAMPMNPQNTVRCDKFALSNDGATAFALNQENGIVVKFGMHEDAQTELSRPGQAQYRSPSVAHTWGTATGGITGRRINITVNWTQGPGAGYTGTYTGQVDEHGVSSGTTTDNRGTTKTWRGRLAHNCLEASASPAPGTLTPLPGGKKIGKRSPARTATVTTHTNLYDKPAHEGGVWGGQVLRANEVHEVVKACDPDAWCQLVGKGWGWGGHFTNN